MPEKYLGWYLAETERLTVQLSVEHRGHMWLDWEQAEEQLTHGATRVVLQKAREHMKKIGKD